MNKKFDTSKHGAAKAGVQLSDEVANWRDGLTKYPKLKRDWRFCPRCGKKTVNRSFRKCENCKGRLLFPGDDGNECIRTMEHFYMWHTACGVTGWFDCDFWEGGFASNKY